jgi:hypothetical protein
LRRRKIRDEKQHAKQMNHKYMARIPLAAFYQQKCVAWPMPCNDFSREEGREDS